MKPFPNPMRGAGRTRLLRSAFVHREARGDLPLLVCLAVLVAVLTGLSAVGPTALARLQDQGLRQRMAVAERTGPLVTVDTALVSGLAAEAPGLPANKPTALATLAREGSESLIDAGGSTLASTLAVQRFDLAFDTDALQVPLPVHGDIVQAKLTPHYLSDAAAHVHYVQGQAPADRTPAGSLPGISVSQAGAELLGLRVGQQVTLSALVSPYAHGSFVITGIYQPVERGDDFWNVEGVVNEPEEGPALGLPGMEVIVGALLGADGADRITADGLSLDTIDWQFRVTPGRAAVAQANGLRADMQAYSADLQLSLCAALDANGNQTCMVGGDATTGFTVGDQLTPMLTAFDQENDQFEVLASFAIASLVAVGLATMVVAVRLLLRRRSGHLALRRARGASTTELVLTRTAAAVPVCLVAGAIGWPVGLALSPGGTSGRPEPLLGLIAVCLALLLVPLLTWYAVREPGSARKARRQRPVRGRRQVVEGTVLLLCVAGVTVLRLRSGDSGTGGVDVQLSAVPVLVALTGVLVLLRVYPLVLRLLAGWAGRGGGTVAFVGLRRAGRDAPATSLALFVLVLTLGTAVFGGLISQTVHDGTAVGAQWTSGADAVAVVPGTLQPQAGSSKGITSVVEHLRNVSLSSDSDGTAFQSVAMISVDQSALAAADPGSPLLRALGGVTPGGFVHSPGSELIPAAVSAQLAAEEPHTDFSAVTVAAAAASHDTVQIKPVGTLDRTALDDPVLGPLLSGLPPGTLVVVTGQPAEKVLPAQPDGSTAVVLFAGPRTTQEQLRSTAAVSLGALARISTRSDALAVLRGDGLTRALGTVYTVCTVLAVLFALLAVALELVLTARERGRTTSYLRTLGLGGRAAAGLQVLQLVPLAVAAAVGGVLLGVLEPRVLGPALQLVEFTAGPGAPALHTDFGLTVGLGVGLAVLVLGAAVVETVVARMRRLESVLRLGEQ